MSPAKHARTRRRLGGMFFDGWLALLQSITATRVFDVGAAGRPRYLYGGPPGVAEFERQHIVGS